MPEGAGPARGRALKIVLGLWLLQAAWLGWRFAPEAADVGRRLLSGESGPAVHRQDPFYQFLGRLAAVIPADATYVFVDRYEAGQDIMARYVLYPRTFVRFGPEAPPSFLFATLARRQAAYLVIRDGRLPPGWRFLADGESPAFTPVDLNDTGLVWRVDASRLGGRYYD